jgi:hypothetical protein
MCKVLNENMIKNEILPHFSEAKREFKIKDDLVEEITAILYKLKMGVWNLVGSIY